MLRSTFLRYCTAARTFSTVGGNTGGAGRVTVGSRGTGGSTTGVVVAIWNTNLTHEERRRSQDSDQEDVL